MIREKQQFLLTPPLVALPSCLPRPLTRFSPQTLVSVKDEVRQHEEVIREKQQFYENEIDNNKELEHKIAFSERTAAKLRSDYQGLETERDQFSSEVRASDDFFGVHSYSSSFIFYFRLIYRYVCVFGFLYIFLLYLYPHSIFTVFNLLCISAFEQSHLEPCCFRNGFIIIIIFFFTCHDPISSGHLRKCLPFIAGIDECI